MNTNILAMILVGTTSSFVVSPLLLLQLSYAWVNPDIDPVRKASIAVSGDNNAP
jgi:hypothetical protein